MNREQEISAYRAEQMARLQPMFDQLKADGVLCEIIPTESDLSYDSQGYEPEVVEAFEEMVDKHGLWGWCDVEVRLSKQIDPFGPVATGSAYLGGCSYADQADFMTGGYMPQMLEEAIQSLHSSLCDIDDAE